MIISVATVAIAIIIAYCSPSYAYMSTVFDKIPLLEFGETADIIPEEKDVPVIDLEPLSTLRTATLPNWVIPLSSNNDELKPFLGIWRGQWEGTLDCYFVITEEKNVRVKVFYSWGTNAIAQQSGMSFMWGAIHNGVLLILTKGTSVSLTPKEDKTIFGLYYSQRVYAPSRIILTRINTY